MTISEGKSRIEKLVGKRFSAIFSESDMSDIIRTKGKTGVLLEKAIGLVPVSHNHDFEDGELKSNKCDSSGKPLETIFISQISGHIDELLSNIPFSDSWIYSKINRMLYVPVAKDSSNPLDWFFLPPIFVDLVNRPDIYKQLDIDFTTICKKMIADVEGQSHQLHTSSGELIQIRTKDKQPYTPIHSNKYKRDISNKYFAFYFKKEFVNLIKNK